MLYSDQSVIQETKTNAKRTFYTLSIDHGVVTAEESGSYAYAILPASTMMQTQVYAQSPTVEIVAADSSKHVVRDLTTGTLYANVFSPSYVEDIYVEIPCSLIIRESRDQYEIVVSDPTQQRSEIVLAFDGDVTAESAQTAVAAYSGRVVIPVRKTGESYTVTVKRQ